MSVPTEIQPLGPVPRYVSTQRRRDDLARAIYEYLSAGRTIRPEWVEEYNETVRWLDAHAKSLAAKS